MPRSNVISLVVRPSLARATTSGMSWNCFNVGARHYKATAKFAEVTNKSAARPECFAEPIVRALHAATSQNSSVKSNTSSALTQLLEAEGKIVKSGHGQQACAADLMKEILTKEERFTIREELMWDYI